MSGKSKKGAAKAVPRAYGRLTRHERDTVQRMLERRASCREIARELGRSPSTVSAEVSSHRFVAAPKPRRGERVDAGTTCRQPARAWRRGRAAATAAAATARWAACAARTSSTRPAPRSCARTRCSSRPGAGSTPTSPPRRRGLRPSGTACAGGCRPSRWRRATAGRWTCRPRPSTAGSRRATTA